MENSSLSYRKQHTMIHTTYVFLLIVLLSLRITPVNALHVKTGDESRKKIEAINVKIEQLYLEEDIASIISLYGSNLTFFPEYKPAIFEIGDLKSFYQDWFKDVDITFYRKKIHTIEWLSDHVLEIGTFQLGYTSSNESRDDYTGKYMILWKSDLNGNLQIMSETFSASKYIEAEEVPYSKVQVKKRIVKRPGIRPALKLEIEAFNEEVIKAVAEGDGETRARGFTKDAILLGNFDSIRVGIEAIRPIMLNRYHPGSSYNVNHTYYRIHEIGEYVFINAHYNGTFGDSVNGGMFDGNMSNLMKRNEHGKLKMYRQASNRDSKTVVFSN